LILCDGLARKGHDESSQKCGEANAGRGYQAALLSARNSPGARDENGQDDGRAITMLKHDHS
jgi:hypothetical protein